MVSTPHEGPETSEYAPSSETNHHGFHPAFSAANAASKIPEPRSELHTNNLFAATRWSASAPPMSGETSAQSGGTMKTRATQLLNPLASRMFVRAGSQKPGVIPWRKNTTQSHANTVL